MNGNEMNHANEVAKANSASLVLGVIALVLAIIALLICWIPFLGLVAIPIAAIAILLAVIGLVVAIAKGSGFVLPLVGLLLSLPPIALSLVLTVGASAAINEAGVAINEASVARKKLVDSVIPLVLISDIKLVFESFDENEHVELGYRLTNNSSEIITQIETRVSFMDENGKVVYEDTEYPVSFLDPSMAPGQMTSIDPNMFTYQKVPADKVKSVEITVIDVSLEN